MIDDENHEPGRGPASHPASSRNPKLYRTLCNMCAGLAA